MYLKLPPKLTSMLFFLAATLPLSSQVVPGARQGGVPIVLGAGFSSFNMDWGHGADGNLRYMDGITAWADWNFYNAPGLLRGLGVEVEGRDIDWAHPSGLPQLRHDTFLGGPIYTWRHYRKLYLYGKGFAGIGSIDFQPLPDAPPTYTHDTRTVWALGGGGEYRAVGNFWLRADYEYQWWPQLFGPNALTPNGITLGMVYDFHRFGEH